MSNINKQHQEDFYKFVGGKLSARMKSRGWTINQIAKKEGIQYNTVEAVTSGRPFQFYQMIWIADYIGCSVNDLIKDATTQIFKEGFYGKAEQEERIIQEETKQEVQGGASSFL